MTDREQLEKLAGMYREHISLLDKQRETMAQLLRACIVRLNSPDSRKRREAIKGLTDLADMLEKKNG